MYLSFREDLLSRSDPINEQFLNSFVILSTHYLIGGLARGLKQNFIILIKFFIFS
jgi:hypothetical protein